MEVGKNGPEFILKNHTSEEKERGHRIQFDNKHRLRLYKHKRDGGGYTRTDPIESILRS